jgi:hypothetical protein
MYASSIFIFSIQYWTVFHSLPVFLYMKIPVSINLLNKLTNFSVHSAKYDKHVDSRREE